MRYERRSSVGRTKRLSSLAAARTNCHVSAVVSVQLGASSLTGVTRVIRRGGMVYGPLLLCRSEKLQRSPEQDRPGHTMLDAHLGVSRRGAGSPLQAPGRSDILLRTADSGGHVVRGRCRRGWPDTKMHRVVSSRCLGFPLRSGTTFPMHSHDMLAVPESQLPQSGQFSANVCPLTPPDEQWTSLRELREPGIRQ